MWDSQQQKKAKIFDYSSDIFHIGSVGGYIFLLPDKWLEDNMGSVGGFYFNSIISPTFLLCGIDTSFSVEKRKFSCFECVKQDRSDKQIKKGDSWALRLIKCFWVSIDTKI